MKVGDFLQMASEAINEKRSTAVFNPNEGDDIWIDDFRGPRCGVFKMVWPAKKKVLVEFHGEPELINLEKCFVSRSECYSKAASRKNLEAMELLRCAAEYMDVANGQEPDVVQR